MIGGVAISYDVAKLNISKRARVRKGSARRFSAVEYTASDVQCILQEIFPRRKLVLSQLTLFSQNGVCIPTGSSFRRGRRCYVLQDVLPAVCVLALKEEGIPFKNISFLPQLIRNSAELIMQAGCGVRITGCGNAVSLVVNGNWMENVSIDALINEANNTHLFWSCDASALGSRLVQVSQNGQQSGHKQLLQLVNEKVAA